MPLTYPEPFSVLAAADGVALGPFGFAAYRSPTLIAYEQALPIAAQHEELLMDMVRHATPSGRLYAALLLARSGSPRTHEAWQLLSLEDQPVSYAPGGCMLFTTTLAHYARGVLQNGTPGLFLTPERGARERPPAPHPAPHPGSWWNRYAAWLIGLFWAGVALWQVLAHR